MAKWVQEACLVQQDLLAGEEDVVSAVLLDPQDLMASLDLQEAEECLAMMDHLVPKVILETGEPLVHLDPKERLETLEDLVHLVCKVSEELLEEVDLSVHGVHLA